ncbi:MAG: gamma-glutamylcyclotransferase [Leptospiraceae bacterium]|nr:gamma-glutamylcyclotransferase [Leptospiraceae bacterium]
MEIEKEYIFVYGTLRRGFKVGARSFFENFTKFLSVGYIQGKLFEVSFFPALIQSNNQNDKVSGEIYEIIKEKERFFRRIDYYEGSMYERKKINVISLEGDQIQCWVYLYIKPVTKLEEIPSGDYIQYANDNPRKFRDIFEKS